MKQAHSDALNDFKAATGKTYADWCENRAKEILAAKVASEARI